MLLILLYNVNYIYCLPDIYTELISCSATRIFLIDTCFYKNPYGFKI